MFRAYWNGVDRPSLVRRLISPAIGRNKSSTFRFWSAQPAGTENKMEQEQEQEQQQQESSYKNTSDDMSHSFGEGYATRSNDEGFGGIYGRNETVIHEKSLENNGSQGSEVKEKENAQKNQQKACD